MSDWQLIETAPKEGQFLVYGAFADGKLLRMMVADGHMLALSLARDTPRHLSGHHWTHWMPLPSPPLLPPPDAPR